MIEYYNNHCYLSAALEKRLHSFFTHVFQGFHQELNHLSDIVYKDKKQRIYQYIERTWVSVFNNSLKRAYPGAATIEEFYVALEQGSGRADYFVRLPLENIDILFEAKMYEDHGSDDSNKMGDWYKQIIDQAFQYYKAESNDYLNETYLVALIFGWMRQPKAIANAKKYMDLTNDEKKEIDPCDFCALFHDSEHAVWVYGKVEKASLLLK